MPKSIVVILDRLRRQPVASDIAMSRSIETRSGGPAHKNDADNASANRTMNVPISPDVERCRGRDSQLTVGHHGWHEGCGREVAGTYDRLIC